MGARGDSVEHSEPIQRWDDPTQPKWLAQPPVPSRVRRFLKVACAAMAGLAILVFADWVNAGTWTTPRDMVLVSVSGLPEGSGAVFLVAGKDGQTKVLGRYLYDDYLLFAGPPSRAETGLVLFGGAKEGRYLATFIWRDADQVGVVFMNVEEVWCVAWIPASDFTVRGSFIPCVRRTCQLDLGGRTVFPATEEFWASIGHHLDNGNEKRTKKK